MNIGRRMQELETELELSGIRCRLNFDRDLMLVRIECSDYAEKLMAKKHLRNAGVLFEE